MVQCLLKRNVSLCFALVALILVAQTVSAENVTIDGLGFPVDALSSVDAQTSKVTVNGVTKLLVKSTVDDFIVETSLKNTKFLSNTSANSLAQFFLASLKGGHRARAKAALEGILFLKDASAVKAIVAALDRPLGDGAERIERGTIEAFKGVLVESDAGVISHEIAAEILVAVGIRNPEWIKTTGSRFAIQHSEAYKFATDRTIEDLIEKRNFEAGFRKSKTTGARPRAGR